MRRVVEGEQADGAAIADEIGSAEAAQRRDGKAAIRKRSAHRPSVRSSVFCGSAPSWSMMPR